MLATLAVAIAVTKTAQPALQPKLQIPVVLQQSPNFSRDVVIPLQKQQAEEAAAAQAAAAAQLAEANRIKDRVKPFGTFSNFYAWGNCTWYVASRIDLPSFWGNADGWYRSAQAAGFAVSDQPMIGAIATTTAGWWGHVAIVEDVNPTGGSVYISEMNVNGFGVIDYRWTSTSDFRYIY